MLLLPSTRVTFCVIASFFSSSLSCSALISIVYFQCWSQLTINEAGLIQFIMHYKTCAQHCFLFIVFIGVFATYFSFPQPRVHGQNCPSFRLQGKMSGNRPPAICFTYDSKLFMNYVKEIFAHLY